MEIIQKNIADADNNGTKAELLYEENPERER